MAASATFALKAGVWFRRGRLFIVSPDSLAQRARCQAETPLIVLFRFLRPALGLMIGFGLVLNTSDTTRSACPESAPGSAAECEPHTTCWRAPARSKRRGGGSVSGWLPPRRSAPPRGRRFRRFCCAGAAP